MVRNLINASAVVVFFVFVFTSTSHAQQLHSQQKPVEGISAPVPSADKLEDFSRLSQAIGQRILLTDPSGLVREGVLAEMTADGVTMRFGSATQSFARAEIGSAERLKDGTADGVIKGMLFAAICGVGDITMGAYLSGIVGFGVIGYLVDAGETHREPLYRAPGFFIPTVSQPSARQPAARSVAFRIRF